MPSAPTATAGHELSPGAVLTSLTEHQLLVFWVQLATLLALARLLGGLMQRLGQPSVIGELLAGIVLGPSVFGKIWPAGFEWFLPDDPAQSAALLAVSWVGVALLLLVTGFETDPTLIRRMGAAVAYVGTGSLGIPLVVGFGIGMVLPDSFIGTEDDRVLLAMFMAVALSISALPVIAKILSELGLMRRNFGQLILAAGMLDDVAGWLLLGVIAGLASSGEFDGMRLVIALGGLVVFTAAAFTVGQFGVDRLFRRLRSRGDQRSQMGAAVAVALGCAVITQALGVEAVLGAFVAGIVLGRSRFLDDAVPHSLASVSTAVFAPIFFATAGLRVDLGALREPQVLAWAVAVIVLASGVKFAGAMVGARLARLPFLDGLALGAGLNARGALEIVVATVGLSLGVLSVESYTVVVLMAMVTSAMAPPLLRVIARRWEGTGDERGRLATEEALRSNVVVRSRPLLLPSRGGPNSIAAAQVLHFAWPEAQPVTVLSVWQTTSDQPELFSQVDITPLENVFADRPHEVRRVQGDVAAAALAEARLGYGLVGVGANDRPSGGRLVSDFVDDLVSLSPVPVAIVRRARNITTPLPGVFSRAVVPVTGSPASRAAQEVAFGISARLGTEVVLVHVLSRGAEATPAILDPQTWVGGGAGFESVADRLMDEASVRGERLGARIRTEIRIGASAGDQLMRAADELDADVIVLGATVRRLDGGPFLGHTAEQVLAEADPTVVVVSVPPDWG